MRRYSNFSILIVTYNSASHLARCLDSLNSQTCPGFEVIVVDNGSSDESVATAEKHQNRFSLKIITQKENIGFAAANNIGARAADGEWLVLLNADAFPEPDWLEKLLRAAEEHPEYVAFSSRQVSADEPDFLDGAGDSYHVSGLAWRRYIGYPAQEYGMQTCEVFSPCAAAAMYRRTAFLEAGGFDEDFFAYYEDVDLGFRLRLLGYRTLYVSDAVVFHVGSSTFGKRSEFAFYHSHRNLVWTFVKNMPAELFWKYLPFHVLANLIYLTYYSLRLPGKAIWKGKIDSIRGFHKIFKKRRDIQSCRHASIEEIDQAFERGLFQPYTLGMHLRRALKKYHAKS